MGSRFAPLISLAVLLLLLLPQHAVAASSTGLPNCSTSCGNVSSVPYPFGIGAGCYHSPGFNLTCDSTRTPPRLLLGDDGAFHVLNISLANATVRAARIGGINITSLDGAGGAADGRAAWRGLGGDGGPYALSDDSNEMVIVRGCDVLAQLTAGESGSGNVTISGCASFCPGSGSNRDLLSLSDGRCTGVGCCQMPISIGRSSYDVQYRRLDVSWPPEHDPSGVLLVLIAKQGWLQQMAASTRGAPLPVNLDETPVPVLLGWAIGSAPLGQDGWPLANSTCSGNAARSACRSRHSSCSDVSTAVRSGYVCDCQQGYHGNPYLADGCQDVNECERPEDYGCFGECINQPGTFKCRCPSGTQGNHSQPHGCAVPPLPPASSSTVTGKGADPWDLKDRIESRTHRPVAFVSPPNPPAAKKKSNDGAADGKKLPDDNKAKSKTGDDKKKNKEPPPESTVVVKIGLHCNGCIDRIKRTAHKIKGVKQVTVDTAKEHVTVKGTMDAKALPDVLRRKLKRDVALVAPPPPAKPKDGAAGGDKSKKKQHQEGGESAADKVAGEQQQQGGGKKKNKNNKQEDGGEEDAGGAAAGQEAFAMAVMYGGGGEGSSASYRVEMLHAPQLFSDENPNACAVM